MEPSTSPEPTKLKPSRRSSRKRVVPVKLREQEESDEPSFSALSSRSKKLKKAKTKTPKKTTSHASKSKGKAKQKTRTKVGKAKAFTAEELEAARENAEERNDHINDLVNQLSHEQCKDLLAAIAKEQPGIILEMMELLMAGDEPGDEPPPPPGRASPPWCVCGNCHIMQNAIEDLCCGQSTDLCVSNTPEMTGLILDPQVLNLNMLYRADVLAIQNIGQDDPRAKNKSFRHAAYRQYVLWQYGRLRRGERKVINSCCVWKIRDRYPDPSGQYVPFQPGQL